MERLDGLLDFFSEPVEGLHELLLLLGFAGAPVIVVKFVNKGFVDVVDDRVESKDCVFTDFTEEHLVVVGAGGGNWLAWRDGASHKVDTLALNLFFFAISDEELVGAAGDFGGLSRLLVGFVGLLEVDEDVGGACSFDPILQDVFVLGVREGL